MIMSGKLSYEKAGVSISGGDAWVETIKELLKKRPKDENSVGGVGGFAGLYRIGGGQCIAALVQLFVAHIALGDIHQHDHGKHPLQDALGHVLDVDIQFAAKGRDFGDHANGIMTHDRNKCFHNFYPII